MEDQDNMGTEEVNKEGVEATPAVEGEETDENKAPAAETPAM